MRIQPTLTTAVDLPALCPPSTMAHSGSFNTNPDGPQMPNGVGARSFFERTEMSITLTKAQALEIQRTQVAHYTPLCENLAASVAAKTTAEKLEDGIEYPIHVINKHIPRGGAIEALIGLDVGPKCTIDRCNWEKAENAN